MMMEIDPTGPLLFQEKRFWDLLRSVKWKSDAIKLPPIRKDANKIIFFMLYLVFSDRPDVICLLVDTEKFLAINQFLFFIRIKRNATGFYFDLCKCFNGLFRKQKTGTATAMPVCDIEFRNVLPFTQPETKVIGCHVEAFFPHVFCCKASV